MDKLQAAAQLNPGTAWNLRGDILEQSEDGTPRVSIPTPKELDVVILQAPIAVTLEERISNLEAEAEK